MAIKHYKPGLTENQVMAIVKDAALCFGIVLERRNTGAGLNPAGRMVRFGTPGDSDLVGIVPVGPNRGRTIAVECKKEGFRQGGLRHGDRSHFDCQISRLRAVNNAGGIGFWTDGHDISRIFSRIASCRGLRVVFEGYSQYLEWDDEKSNP